MRARNKKYLKVFLINHSKLNTIKFKCIENGLNYADNKPNCNYSAQYYTGIPCTLVVYLISFVYLFQRITLHPLVSLK